MTKLLTRTMKNKSPVKSIHLASCTTTISVYVKYIKYRFAYLYPVFWESGCKGITFFPTDQILNEIFSKKDSFSYFPLTEIKENEEQNRQLTSKTANCPLKNQKSSIYTLRGGYFQ